MKKINKIERIETGIPGLDKLIEGGIPSGTLNILAGHCGTGKGTFAMQFLHYGAKEKNEPGLYISLEKEPKEILENSDRSNWDLEDLIKKKKLSIIKLELQKFDTLRRAIGDEIDRIDAKRLVIDPFSLLTAYLNNVYDVRKALTALTREVKQLDCTALAIVDTEEGKQALSSTGFEEFAVSGVIVLDLILKKDSNSFIRTVLIIKMARTNHSLKLVPLEIGGDGISTYPETEVF